MEHRELAVSRRRVVDLLLIVGLAATVAVGRLVVPISIRQLIDHGISAGSSVNAGVVRNVLITASVALVGTALGGYLVNVRLVQAIEREVISLRTRCFRRAHELSIGETADERRGSLVSRMTTDMEAVSQFAQWGGPVLITAALQVVVAAGLMFTYSWELTITVLVIFSPLFLLLRKIQGFLSTGYRGVRDGSGFLSGVLAETLAGIGVLRLYHAERVMLRRLDGAVDDHFAAQVRAQRRLAGTFSLSEIAGGLANAAVITVGIWLGVGGGMTAGEVTAFLFLANLLVGPAQIGTEILSEGQNALAGWRRAREILSHHPAVVDPGPRGRDLPSGAAEVTFDGVSYGYPGGAPVLRDIELVISAGSKVAIVGETGSGKTTLAMLVCRMLDPGRGRVLINGRDIRQFSLSSLRRRVLMVPQHDFLVSGTIRDNMRLACPDADDADIVSAFVALDLADWLASLPAGLDTRITVAGDELSGGERQLVALVRAFLADPDLLILDEATSAVDPGLDANLREATRRLTARRTVITIAHRLSTVEDADEVLILDQGRIVEKGPHRVLIGYADGRYAQLYGAWRR